LQVSGEYEAKLDRKGRVIVPAAHRNRIAPNAELRLVAALDGRKTIMLCEEDYLQTFAKGMRETMPNNVQAQHLSSILVGRAKETQIDAQGRMLLPASLREKAGIANDVRFVGNTYVIEIWNPATHDQWESEILASVKEEDLAKIVFGGPPASERAS